MERLLESNDSFTQRRKGRKDAKARPKHLTRLCVFASFASLRETFPISALASRRGGRGPF